MISSSSLPHRRVLIRDKCRLIFDSIKVSIKQFSITHHEKLDSVYRRLNLTPERLERLANMEDDISLHQILEWEHDLWCAFLTPTSTFQHFDMFYGTVMGTPTAKLLNIEPLPAYPQSLVDEMVAIDAKFRISRAPYRKFELVFKVPVAYADKHGLKYRHWTEVASEERKPLKFVQLDEFVLTDDGFVVPAFGVTPYVNRMRGAKRRSYLYTLWGMPSWYENGTTDKFFCSDTVERLWRKSKRVLDGPEDVHLGLNMRMLGEEMFSSAFVATGDYELAEAISFPISRISVKERMRTVNTERVRMHMADAMKDALNAALKARGISTEGEAYVFGTLIDMTDEIMKLLKAGEATDKMLAVAHMNIEKIGKYIAMGPDTVTTERTLQIGAGEGAILAKQIEERRERVEPDEVHAEVEVVKE